MELALARHTWNMVRRAVQDATGQLNVRGPGRKCRPRGPAGRSWHRGAEVASGPGVAGGPEPPVGGAGPPVSARPGPGGTPRAPALQRPATRLGATASLAGWAAGVTVASLQASAGVHTGWKRGPSHVTVHTAGVGIWQVPPMDLRCAPLRGPWQRLSQAFHSGAHWLRLASRPSHRRMDAFSCARYASAAASAAAECAANAGCQRTLALAISVRQSGVCAAQYWNCASWYSATSCATASYLNATEYSSGPCAGLPLRLKRRSCAGAARAEENTG